MCVVSVVVTVCYCVHSRACLCVSCPCLTVCVTVCAPVPVALCELSVPDCVILWVRPPSALAVPVSAQRGRRVRGNRRHGAGGDVTPHVLLHQQRPRVQPGRTPHHVQQVHALRPQPPHPYGHPGARWRVCASSVRVSAIEYAREVVAMGECRQKISSPPYTRYVERVR